eukprot:scaffold9743_cov190-Skeletonema_marinoi.AAC.2
MKWESQLRQTKETLHTIEESRSVGSQTESDLHLLAFKLTFRHNTSITAEPDQHMKQRKLTYYVALRLAKAELL